MEIEIVTIHELKTETGRILRAVRDEGVTYAVTHDGQVIARIVPADMPTPMEDDTESLLAMFDRLAVEISGHVSTDTSAVDMVREVRRDL